MKRFTETDKWLDPWFQELEPDAKLVWLYVLDRCDNAGVWEPNKRLANFTIGRDIDWPAVESLFTNSGRMAILADGKWNITKFIAFQYGQLSEECPPHRQVLRLVEKHGLHADNGKGNERVVKPFQTGKETPQDKDKEKDLVSVDRGVEKTPLQLRIESWFHRRETTAWGKDELKAWKNQREVIEATPEEDLEALTAYYCGPTQSQYRRRDIATLLNHWTGEIDRAKDRKEYPNGDNPDQGRNSRSFGQRNEYSGVDSH